MEANKRAARKVRNAEINYEKRMAENVKFDSESFFFDVSLKSK